MYELLYLDGKRNKDKVDIRSYEGGVASLSVASAEGAARVCVSQSKLKKYVYAHSQF